MKHLVCKEVTGYEHCAFVAESETVDEVIDKLKAHGAETHPELMEGKSEEELLLMHHRMEESTTDA